MASRSKIAFRVISGIVLAASVISFAMNAYTTRKFGFADFPILLRQAADYVQTGTLYTFAGDLKGYAPTTAAYKWPPPLMLLIVPILNLGSHAMLSHYHFLLQIAVYLASMLLGLHVFGLWGNWFYCGFAVVVALNFAPFFETLFGLQMETYILFLLLFALYFLRQNKNSQAGVALSVAAVVKIYPGFFFLYLALERRWMALAGGAAIGALLGGLAFVFFGIEQNMIYYLKILPYLLQENPLLAPVNLSISGYVQWLIVDDPGVAKRWGQFLGLILISMTLYAVYRDQDSKKYPTRGLLEFSIFVPLVLLVITNSWTNYQLLLLLPIYALLGHALRTPEHRATVVPLVASFCVFLFLSVNHASLQENYFVFVPRSLHDAVVNAKIVPTLIIWSTLWCILMGWDVGRWTRSITSSDTARPE